MRLLITGGCGFLGSNLAAEALRRGWELTVFDNLSRVGAERNRQWLEALGNFHFVAGDVADAEAVERCVGDWAPEAIFHLAGQVAMTSSLRDPRRDFLTNAQGSLNVLEAVRRLAPRCAVLYSSTNKVYGDLEQFDYETTGQRYRCVQRPEGFDEHTPLDFQSPYGCSKGSADQYMLDYARMFGLRTLVFRHSSMYGGRQFATADQGWIGWFCSEAQALARGERRELSIAGNGLQVRDVLHADDMVALYFKACERLDVVAGQAFNIGGGMANSLSLLELFQHLEQALRVKLPVQHGPVRHSDQKVFVADLTKARALLDWQPQVSTEAGLAAMLAWTQGLEAQA
ncbi:GDP-mannose 4,6-dehydratase [Pseudomonas oryzihabitans]|uniref:GDP-mannose 4,6-dehydratase n=1 Tax=Pseudomonas oryzihabitans TaxID=47885 RepID=UPI0028957E0E|nr:GDP-mannose 4,6-dehydratase [Pseudomonas oryzihabitans]MDT3719869.1 GDP-mannose 4,6-dehydratase [Pseudomonas oryzihabitans]